MKTELVVLRKVNEEVLLFNLAVNPRKWANVTEGALVSYTDSFGRRYAFNWDAAQVGKLLPDAYRCHLVLRSWILHWIQVRYYRNFTFREWILTYKVGPMNGPLLDIDREDGVSELTIQSEAILSEMREEGADI